MKKRIIVPVLCSSSLKYRYVYRLGVLKTFGASKPESPKVIPYFGSISIFRSTLVDTIHTVLALTKLIRFRRVWISINTNRRASHTSEIPTKDDFVSSVVIVDGSSLKFEIQETTGNVALRFLEMLDWILVNEQVDFIWHSNISTYLNLKRMQEFLDQVDSELYYAGIIGEFSEFSFVSGASVCLGRDSAELVISNRKQWDFSLPWDVALGKLLHDLNVKPTLINRVDLMDPKNVQHLSDEQLRMTINFRCKSGRWIRRDHKIMKLLHSRISILD